MRKPFRRFDDEFRKPDHVREGVNNNVNDDENDYDQESVVNDDDYNDFVPYDGNCDYDTSGNKDVDIWDALDDEPDAYWNID